MIFLRPHVDGRVKPGHDGNIILIPGGASPQSRATFSASGAILFAPIR
jgi:hypothetical protein